MIIREKNEKDLSIIKKYLDLIFRSTYESFLKGEKDGLIVKSFICENPNGFVYVNKNKESYGIKFAFEDDPSNDDLMTIHDEVKKYLDDKEIKKIYITCNSSSKNILNYYDLNHVQLWYTAYEMEYKNDVYNYKPDTLEFKAYDEKYLLDFIELLDESFRPLRLENNIVPLDCYGCDLEESKEEFHELNEEGKIKGVWDKEELIGVTIIEGNEIDTIAIKKEHQNKGYGRRILYCLMNHLMNEKKYNTIHLGVIASNKIAFDLYDKSGFNQVGSITYLKRV